MSLRQRTTASSSNSKPYEGNRMKLLADLVVMLIQCIVAIWKVVPYVACALGIYWVVTHIG